MPSFRELTRVVQRNCDIADAGFAREYSLCVYLMKMREYYRWEKGLDFSAELPREDVGRWVVAREHRWDGLESEDYRRLPLASGDYEPFDDDGINRELGPRGLVYGAGIGRWGAPHFFLARLDDTRRVGEVTVRLSSREYARDLTAPPAMTRGRGVFVRRESLRRFVWELIEDWRWRPHPGPVARLLDRTAFDADPETAIERLTACAVEVAILHEIGEARAGDLLGAGWESLLQSVSGTRAELGVRAVRDHLADCSHTLPALLAAEDPMPIDLFFANLGAMRKSLFPSAVAAYERGVAHGVGHGVSEGGHAPLRDLLPEAGDHWRRLAEALLALRASDDDLPGAVDALIEREGAF